MMRGGRGRDGGRRLTWPFSRLPKAEGLLSGKNHPAPATVQKRREPPINWKRFSKPQNMHSRSVISTASLASYETPGQPSIESTRGASGSVSTAKKTSIRSGSQLCRGRRFVYGAREPSIVIPKRRKHPLATSFTQDR